MTKKIGCKSLEELGMKTDNFEHLINDYIPGQGNKDMGMFIDLGLSTYNYTLWKMYDMGCMKKSFIEPFKKQIKEMCGVEL